MKAYNMKSPGLDSKMVVRIVKGDEVVKDKSGQVMEKLGGPIGGSGILPEPPNPSDDPKRFVVFKLDNGRMIRTESEMLAAYSEMYGPEREVETTIEEEARPTAKKRGRPKRVIVGDEETASAA